MAIFGRRTARQRLRSAAESLRSSSLGVNAPPDCAPWVLGDLWPAELPSGNAETATLAGYLDADLRRIVASANDKLQAISRSTLAGRARYAAEARVVDAARAFAALRVESTIRQLGKEPERRPESRSHPSTSANPAAQPVQPGAVVGPAVDEPAPQPERPGAVDEPAIDEPAQQPAEPQSDERRLRRLLEFVARQEPGLRWAVGIRGDDSTVLVTDLAHGWIPPGIDLPAGVRLLEPGRRNGNAAALLGTTTVLATYAPGDRLGWPTEYGPTDSTHQPRQLPVIDDLGSTLIEATHRRNGLPPIVKALAAASAAGTGVAEAQIDLLRVHLDTARYRLLARYPDLDTTLLLNCLLLAATADLATGDQVSANYHLAWFEALNVPAMN